MPLTIDGTLRDFNDLFSFSVDMEERNDEINPKDEVESTDELEVRALLERGAFLLSKVARSSEELYEFSVISTRLGDIFLDRFKDDYVNRPEKLKKCNFIQDPRVFKAFYLHRVVSEKALEERLNLVQKVEETWHIFIQYLWKAGSFAIDAGKFIFKVGKGFSAAFLKFSPSLFNTINLNIGIGGFKNTELLLIKDKQLQQKDQQLVHKDTQIDHKDEQLASQEKRMALLEQEILEERQQVRMERETNRLLEGRMTELKVKYKAVKKTLKQRTKAQKTDRAFKDIYRTPSFDSSKYACRSASEDKDLFSSHTAPMTSY